MKRKSFSKFYFIQSPKSVKMRQWITLYLCPGSDLKGRNGRLTKEIGQISQRIDRMSSIKSFWEESMNQWFSTIFKKIPLGKFKSRLFFWMFNNTYRKMYEFLDFSFKKNLIVMIWCDENYGKFLLKFGSGTTYLICSIDR